MEHQWVTQTVNAASNPMPAHLWQQQREKDAIRAIFSQFAAAWSDGDVALLASLLSSDCDHVTLARVGHLRRGRAELVDSWTAAFARRCPGFAVHMTVSLRSIRLLGERLALVDGDLEYSGGIGAGGVRQQPCAQPFASVMTRTETDWLILSIRVGATTPAAGAALRHD